MRYIVFIFLLLSIFSCKKDDDQPQIPYPLPPEGELPPLPADVYIYQPCDTSTGVARAYKLGNDWISGAELIRYEANDTLCWYLHLLTCSASGPTREKIFLGGFTDSDPIGTYSVVFRTTVLGYIGIHAFSTYSLLGDDGDVLLDHYRPDTSGTSIAYLKITRWDTIAHIGEGHFHLAYKATHVPTSDPKHYEFMKFSSGRFWAKIPE